MGMLEKLQQNISVISHRIRYYLSGESDSSSGPQQVEKPVSRQENMSLHITESSIEGDVVGRDKTINQTFIIVDSNTSGINEVITNKINFNEKSEDDNDTENKELILNCWSLLHSATPPNLVTFFPEANPNVLHGLSLLETTGRRIVRQNSDGNCHMSTFADLLSTEDIHHLIVGPGGGGKTYSLWHLAAELLKSGHFIPIYLPLPDFSSADEVISFLERKLSPKGITALTNNNTIVFLLDGWSQFPSEQGNDSERRKLLSFLGRRRILATARYSTQYDHRFKLWELELLSEETVRTVILAGFPENNGYPEELTDLLRLPLVLILYLLLSGAEVTRGELISAFQKQLTIDLTIADELLKVMGKASASVSLYSQGKKRSDFDREILSAAKDFNFKNARQLVAQLGTLGTSQDVVKPIHDLYWDWLAGIGVLRNWERFSPAVMKLLRTRDSLKLALESGEIPTAAQVKEVSYFDIILAAAFLPYLRRHILEGEAVRTEVIENIRKLMKDPRPLQCCRGVIAALLTKEGQLFLEALTALSSIDEKGYYFPEVIETLKVIPLWKKRSGLSNWLPISQGKGTHYLLESIQQTGDSRWVDWLEREYRNGSLTRRESVGTALACTNSLPSWIRNELNTLVLNDHGAYYFRNAVKRGKNLVLAQWVYDNYATLVNSCNSGWYDLNKVLVHCGNKELFKTMLSEFGTFELRVQELLLYAIEEFDPQLVAEMQIKFFDSDFHSEHSKLFETVNAEIPDEVARRWTYSANIKICIHGWKTLAHKHQNAILPELISNLPESFTELHVIPTLKAMGYISELPESLIAELWQRVQGNMQPMAMDDVLRILAKIRPHGVPSIVGQLRQNPGFLPAYHLARVISYIKKWEEETKLKFMARFPSGDIPFMEFLVLEKLKTKEEGVWLADLCNEVKSNRIFERLKELFLSGSLVTEEIIDRMGGIWKYDADLVAFLLQDDESGRNEKLVKWFGKAFADFPESEMILVLYKVRESPKKTELLTKIFYEIAQSPTPNHERLYSFLLVDLFSFPETANEYKQMASILATLETWKLKVLLNDHSEKEKSKVLWLIRLIEPRIGQLLVNEKGEWF